MLYFIYKKKSSILHKEFFTSKEFRYLLISILVACLLAVFILNPIVDLSENFTACSQLRIAIYKKWKENGISMPYQTITIC